MITQFPLTEVAHFYDDVYLSDENYGKLLAYFAGFFDGEGCIFINRFWSAARQKRFYALQITVTNTNPVPLKLYQEIYGGALRYRKRNKSHEKSTATWTVKSAMAENFLEDMIPHLIVKKDEAEVALEYRKKCIKVGGRPLTKHEWRPI